VVVVVIDPSDEHGDPDPMVRLAALHALAKRTVPSHGGSIEFVVGDAVVLTFATPLGAMAAIGALRQAWPTDGGALRVGVQAGRVVRVPEGGIVGAALSQADRLRRQALPGEVRDGGRHEVASAA
jgi:class 3 adenylate cyclase